MYHVMITAGGTGGHVFPALSLYTHLKELGYACTFVTDKRGAQYLKDIPFEVLDFHWGEGIVSKVRFFKDILLNTFKMCKLHKSLKPDLVIGFGGYSAFSTILSAQLLKIPTWIMEQNALAGRTNKILSRFASKVFLSFEHTLGLKGECIGNPVRFKTPPQEKSLKKEKFHVLILGGSQGSKALGVPLAEKLASFDSPLTITHQVRANDLNQVKSIYQACSHQVQVETFFDEVESLMHKADLIIARSGASTVFECLYVQKPALFIPYPFAKDNHQYFNAKVLLDKGACFLIEEKDFCFKKLKILIETLYQEDTVAASLRESIKINFPYKNPTQLLAQHITYLLPVK